MQMKQPKNHEPQIQGSSDSSPEALTSKLAIGYSPTNLKSEASSLKLSSSLILDKLLFLEKEIAKVKEHIAKRKSLALAKTQILNQEIARLEAELKALPQLQPPLWQPGNNPNIDSWKSERERRILSLKQELWAIPEQVEHDVIFLEKELRELLREYLPLKRLLSQGH